MRSINVVIGFVILGTCVVGAREAAAQTIGAGIALHIAPSIRAAGMGRSAAAVFWGRDPNYWANPALLGYHRGFRFEHGRTELVPDFEFSDVFFTTDRLTLGYWGIGLSIVGKPFDDLGEIELDYGEIPIVKEDPGGGSGTIIATHRPYEKVNSWALGASLLELAGHILEVTGCETLPFERFGDVAIGYARKTYEWDLAPAIDDPAFDLPEPVKGSTDTYDRGILLRATPYNSVDYSGHFPKLDSFLDRLIGGFRLDVSCGSSSQNYNDATVTFIKGGEVRRIARVSRRGWGLHTATGLPGRIRGYLDDHGLGVVAESLMPLVSFGKAWDRLLPSVPESDGGVRSQETEIEQSGWELTIANIYSIRRGRVDEPEGDIHGHTSGWSLGFCLADLGGFRYYKATVPQSTVLDSVEREGYTVFVDPIEIWRLLR